MGLQIRAPLVALDRTLAMTPARKNLVIRWIFRSYMLDDSIHYRLVVWHLNIGMLRSRIRDCEDGGSIIV